jgi:hypothetical protein
VEGGEDRRGWECRDGNGYRIPMCPRAKTREGEGLGIVLCPRAWVRV